MYSSLTLVPVLSAESMALANRLFIILTSEMYLAFVDVCPDRLNATPKSFEIDPLGMDKENNVSRNCAKSKVPGGNRAKS